MLLDFLRDQWTYHRGRLIALLAVAGVAIWWASGQSSSSPFLIPSALGREIDEQYAQCLYVVGTGFRGDLNPERACREVDVKVVGEGAIPPTDQQAGISRALCLRLYLRTPIWLTPARTQFEEIGWTERVLSKVAVLGAGRWSLPPDHDASDRERWQTFSCPSSYESP
jgi:hypothetical protein